ncbi:MAG: hypothetical protein KIT87_29685 [Anaerolineae bacterium]|nr:hypothetical protein [Anaerolineae bacterium]
MTTKELIHAEIEKVREADLEALYHVIKDFTEAKAEQRQKPGALAKLKRIRISAPEDFAANLKDTAD